MRTLPKKKHGASPLGLFKAFPLLIVVTVRFQKHLAIQASGFGIHASLLKILPKTSGAAVFRMLQKVASDTFGQHLEPCEAFLIWFYMIFLSLYEEQHRQHFGSQGPRPCLRPSRKQMRESDRHITQAPYVASSKATPRLHPLGTMQRSLPTPFLQGNGRCNRLV